MSILISEWLHASNHVLQSMMTEHGVPALDIPVVAPDSEAVQNVERIGQIHQVASGNFSCKLSASSLCEIVEPAH